MTQYNDGEQIACTLLGGPWAEMSTGMDMCTYEMGVFKVLIEVAPDGTEVMGLYERIADSGAFLFTKIIHQNPIPKEK